MSRNGPSCPLPVVFIESGKDEQGWPMIELRENLHNFNPEFFGSVEDLLDQKEAIARDSLMVACADHGTAPDNVSFAGPDRFLILQNLAASIPSPDECVDGVSIQDIEHLFENYPIRHIIVIGHLRCRVIRNWLRAQATMLDVGKFRERFRSRTLAAVDRTYPDATPLERIDVLIHEHVLFQLENLQTHELIRHRLESGSLELFGWVTDDSSARIRQYDPLNNCFGLV